MPRLFSDVMAKKRDDELVAIVTTEREDYQEEALEAAERELAKRKIAPKRLANVKARVVAVATLEVARADVPLSSDEKITCLFVPFVWNLIRSQRWKEAGFKRKSVEGQRWAVYGLGFYFAVAIAIGFLQRRCERAPGLVVSFVPILGMAPAPVQAGATAAGALVGAAIPRAVSSTAARPARA